MRKCGLDFLLSIDANTIFITKINSQSLGVYVKWYYYILSLSFAKVIAVDTFNVMEYDVTTLVEKGEQDLVDFIFFRNLNIIASSQGFDKTMGRNIMIAY